VIVGDADPEADDNLVLEVKRQAAACSV